MREQYEWIAVCLYADEGKAHCLVADSLNIVFVTSATDNSTTEPTFAVNKANSLMKISVAGFFFWKKPFV